jgi:hypothetical protein
MTDNEAEDVVEAAEEADPDDAEHDDATDDEQPDAEELPTPDLSSIPDQDADEDDQGEESDGDQAEQDDSDQPEQQDQQAAQDRADDGDTMGDLYAKMLVNLTNTIVEEHGKPDAKKVDIEAARQADIDHHFDRLMDSVGMGRDLPPGQAVVLTSTFFVGSNLAAKTDAPTQAISELDF